MVNDVLMRECRRCCGFEVHDGRRWFCTNSGCFNYGQLNDVEDLRRLLALQGKLEQEGSCNQ